MGNREMIGGNVKKNLLILIVLLPVFLSALTLEEAVNLALENNNELKMAKDDVKIANRSYKDIKGSLYPQISSQIGVFNQHTNLPDKAKVEVPSLVGMMDSTATANDYAISGFLDDYIQNSLPELEQDITQYGASVKLNQVIYLGGKLTAGIEAAKKYEKGGAKRFTWVEGRTLDDIERDKKQHPVQAIDEAEGCAICHL